MAESHPRVVVFSSDPKEGKLISRHLRDKALRVIRARSLSDCLKSLKKSPDLLLLDLSIKEAWRILRQAKNGHRNGGALSVLAFDPKRNPLREIKAFHLGADGYVGRPQIKEELLSQVTPLVEAGKIAQRYERLLTQEKRRMRSAEEETRKVQDFTEKIASNVPISVILVDHDQRITYVNRNFSRAVGREPRELIGRPLTVIFPETLYGPIELLEKVDEVIGRGHPTPRFSMGYRGVSYAYRVLPIRRREHGKRGRQAMILIENISELKSLGERVQMSEEKYRALFESSPDGILLSRPGGGRILDVNRRASILLGKGGGRSKLKGRAFIQFFSKGVRQKVKRGLSTVAQGPVIDLPELVLALPQGQKRILSVSASTTTHGGEAAVLWIVKDITEERFLENQVRQTEKMSLLGQFTAGAAHEINNPLAIISSHAQYLLSVMNDYKIGKRERGEIGQTLNVIDRESRYCGAIIKNLLAYTHTREIKRETTSLQDVVTNSLKMIGHQLELSNIVVKNEITPDTPRVLGDVHLLQQAVMNLIWNAQAAMPKGGRLTIGVTHAPDGKVKLRVEDTGVGIPKENLEKIFTPFFTTKEVGKGTGLGLWVVRSVVDEHRSKIEVESKVGKGTSFTITLPPFEEKHGNHSRH